YLTCQFSECFFFQAGDGIRDFHVTGVQTCALPISLGTSLLMVYNDRSQGHSRIDRAAHQPEPAALAELVGHEWGLNYRVRGRHEIGRASCREDESVALVAVYCNS